MPIPKCGPTEVYHKKSKGCIEIGGEKYKNSVNKNPAAFSHYSKKIQKVMKNKKTTCDRPDQAYNKLTKRCLTIGGQGFKVALKKDPSVFNDQLNKITAWKVSKSMKPPKTAIKLKPPKPLPVCAPDEVFNKHTRRCVKIGGQSYKLALKKDPTVFDNQKGKIDNFKTMKKKLLEPIVEKKVLLPRLKLSSQLKQVFTKKIKNVLKKSEYKTRNVMKYTDRKKLPPYAFIEKPINISLYHFNYYEDEDDVDDDELYKLFQTPRNIERREVKKLSFGYDNISSNFYKHVLKRDTNPDIIDITWFIKMQEYISKLSNRERFALYSYTKNGDVYINIKERGMKFDYDRFNVKPFFYEFLEYITTNKSVDFDVKFLGMTLSEIKKAKKDTSGRKTATLYRKFLRLPSKQLKHKVVDTLIKMLSDTISRVIKKSPPTTKPMVVFRGVKDCFFAADDFTSKYTSNEVYYNKGFVSSTLDYSVAINTFTNSSSSCCFKVITILPGTRCIPLIGLSHFEGEVEILLDRNIKYIIRDKYTAPVIYRGRTHLLNSPASRDMKISDIIIG